MRGEGCTSEIIDLYDKLSDPSSEKAISLKIISPDGSQIFLEHKDFFVGSGLV